MDISKIFSLITPLTLLALAGVWATLYGFVDMKQENNILQFLFGIPITIGAVGLHLLIRRAVRFNTLRVWIVEIILVAIPWIISHSR